MYNTYSRKTEHITAVDGKIEKGGEATARNALNCRGIWIHETRLLLV